MKISQSLSLLILVTIQFVVNGQQYDPFVPYAFIKNDTSKTIQFSCVSFNEGNTASFRFNFRDPVVLKQVNVSTRGSYERQDEYTLFA